MIRSAKKSDLEAIAANEAAIFSASYPYFVLRQFYDLDRELLLVASSPTGALVGHALGAVGGTTTSAWVLALAVRPEVRGQGFGARLLAELCQRLARLGAKSIRATIAAENLASMKLFEARGFRVIGSEPDWFGPDAARLLLELALSET